MSGKELVHRPQDNDNIVDVKNTGPATLRGKRKALREQFPKLFGLRCWELADKKVKAGIALEEVARWIQDDMLEYRDSKRDSLVRALYRYKGAVSELYPDEVVASKPTEVDEQIKEMARNVNELDELEKLYLLQMKRIGLDVKTEMQINKLFKTTGMEIQTAMQLLDKRMALKMKMGLVQSVPDQPGGNTFVFGGGQPGVTPGGVGIPLSDEQRLRLGTVAEKIFTALAKADDKEVKEVIDITPVQ